LHTVTLSDILCGDEKSFQDPPLLALDAQDGVVGFFTLLGCCGDGTGIDQPNVTAKELEALQKIATDLLKLTSKDLDAHVEMGELQEICHDDQA
jgi:hypothetical protein